LFDTGAGETDGDVNGEETKCLRDEAKNASSSVDVSSVGLRLDVVGDGEVFVSSVVPGGIADAAGVAEGSVLVSAAFVRDDDESSSSDDDDDDDDDECASKEDEDSKDSSKHEDSKAKKKKESSSFLRCGAGAGDARAVAALFARAAKKKSAAREGGERRPSRSVELRLRRNLSRGADVDALARRRARRVAESENGAGTEKLDALASTNPLSSKSTASLGETLDSGSGGVAENLGSPRDVNQSSVSRAWPLPRGAQFVVAWEHALLMDLGGAMSAFGRAAMTRYVGAQAVAHTSLAALASAVAWPVTLLNAGAFIDSPWALAEARSKDAGRALAKALLEGSASGARRPVTIVAYSLGCDVVRAACACLLEAEEEANSEARNRNADRSTVRREDESEEASENDEGLSKEKKNAAPRNEKKSGGLGLIQDLVFVGAPLDASFDTWSSLRRVTTGRVVNAGDFGDLSLAPTSSNIFNAKSSRGGDWMLRFLFRKKTWALRRGVAAWTRVDHPGVENVDVGEVCGVHVEIPDRMGAILRVVGLDA
jgi:hypothetical protein